LLLNPVASKKHYRLYIIHKLPQLRILDFQKIRQRVGWCRILTLLYILLWHWIVIMIIIRKLY